MKIDAITKDITLTETEKKWIHYCAFFVKTIANQNDDQSSLRASENFLFAFTKHGVCIGDPPSELGYKTVVSGTDDKDSDAKKEETEGTESTACTEEVKEAVEV